MCKSLDDPDPKIKSSKSKSLKPKKERLGFGHQYSLQSNIPFLPFYYKLTVDFLFLSVACNWSNVIMTYGPTLIIEKLYFNKY